jgi:hypothetical protein
VYENRVIRRLYGAKRKELTGGLRKLHNKELHNFYYSPNIIRVMKSIRIGWAGRVTPTVRRKMHTEVDPQNPKRTGQLGDLGVVGRIILNWILKKYRTR